MQVEQTTHVQREHVHEQVQSSTLGSPCRLDMLERLCTTWHGWVSAAVYLPLDPYGYTTDLHVALAKLDNLHFDLEENSMCCTDLVPSLL